MPRIRAVSGHKSTVSRLVAFDFDSCILMLIRPQFRSILIDGNAMDRLQVGRWWRHSRYEIRDNDICPVADATCEEYHPWHLFDASRDGVLRSPRGKQLLELPFQDLFRM